MCVHKMHETKHYSSGRKASHRKTGQLPRLQLRACLAKRSKRNALFVQSQTKETKSIRNRRGSMKNFKHQGQFWREFRKSRELTQSELGDIAGVHSQFCSNWERSLCAPPKHALKRIRKYKLITQIDKMNLEAAMLKDARLEIKQEINEIFPRGRDV